MQYEVVDYNGEVLYTTEVEEYAHKYLCENKTAYDIRYEEVEEEKVTAKTVSRPTPTNEAVVVVFWWRQDEVHHGWYGNKEFATLAEARAQYETWTKEGKLANYVAL